VVQCCLRTSERLVHKYPDEPADRVGLSEAWTHLGKANRGAKHYEQAEAALRGRGGGRPSRGALAGLPPAARRPAAPAQALCGRPRQSLDGMTSRVLDDWLGKRGPPEPAQRTFLDKALA
jgi:hypothetical protein